MKKLFVILSLLSLFSLPAFADGEVGEKADGACSDNGCKCINDSKRQPKERKPPNQDKDADEGTKGRAT